MKDLNTKIRKIKWNNMWYYFLMAILAVVFMGSGTMLLKTYEENRKHESDLNAIVSMFPSAVLPAPKRNGENSDESERETEHDDSNETADGDKKMIMDVTSNEWKRWWEQVAESRFASYQALNEQNSDFVGWIRIEGTRIDYPVVQTPDVPDYYLYRDFNKKNSNYGIPYMAENSRFEDPVTSLLIYGHHMKNGGMFAALQNYTKESYFRQHPYIQFDTVDKAGSYEVAAVVKVDASSSVTPWQDLLFPDNEEVWNAAWNAFRQQAFYRTGVELTYEDHLLALVTCEYTLKDGRLMVVARKL